MCLGPFQMEIIEGKVKPSLGETTHVMVMPLELGDIQARGVTPLPPGLHIFHACARLKNGSDKVSVVDRNVSDSHIYLKKGTQVAQIMSASPVLSMELSPEMEATLGVEVWPEPMSVDVHQEKLLEKLNLHGLKNWSPRKAAATRELVLIYHDTFALDSNEQGCTSAIEHKICTDDSEPFKNGFGTYHLHSWKKCTLH